MLSVGGHRLRILLSLWAGAVAGCDDLEEFSTGDGEVFAGRVIGADTDPGDSSFIRTGFASRTEMELTFDPVAAAGFGGDELAGAVGTLSTFRCPGDTESCARDDRESGHFEQAPLEPIANLVHDALSQYDFPGGGRVRNFILGARFRSRDDDGEVRRHAMVFISLMDSGSIEARVIAPSVLSDDGDAERHPALFGVFGLERREQ
ncbi:MAG: hypothetical protein PVI30_27660 [Myxococcales bacterium]|jgi:hypothetical protein